VDVAIQRFVQGMGLALGVWTLLIGLAAAAVVVPAVFSAGRGWREALLRARVRSAATTLRRSRARTRADLLADHARRMAEAGRQAAQAVGERRAEWEAAAHNLEAAWQARGVVDRRAARLALATGLPGAGPARPSDSREPDPVELPWRGRLLRRLATEAYRRGDLSGQRLIGVLTGRGVWSARHDLVELETRLCMAARDHRHEQYRIAVGAERRAWDALEAARGSQDALRAVQPDLAGDPAHSARLMGRALAWPSWTVPAQGRRPALTEA